MFDFVWMEALKIIGFSFSSAITLFIIAKITGKKQIAELSFIDYILGITLGSIAAQMATDLTATPVWYYLIALGVYFLIAVVVGVLELKSPKLKSFFKGNPVTIIYEGKIQYSALKETKISVNELLSMCRAKDFFDVNDIAYAVLETSGDLSILPKGRMKPTAVEDLMEPRIKEAELPCYLVIDGEISYSGLNEIKKDEKWLFKKLNCQYLYELKKYVLVQYDSQSNELILHEK